MNSQPQTFTTLGVRCPWGSDRNLDILKRVCYTLFTVARLVAEECIIATHCQELIDVILHDISFWS
jgi:hypothetical protein